METCLLQQNAKSTAEMAADFCFFYFVLALVKLGAQSWDGIIDASGANSVE